MSTTSNTTANKPQAVLETRDAIGIIVGLIIGSGIFKLPQLVAMNSANEWMFYFVWVAGGVISLVGALCYAELATAYPSVGGDYHFLRRSFGRSIGFLFAWARLTVVTSGSVAILAFVFGDYASNLLNLGSQSSAIYAVLAVIVFTAINLSGIRGTKGTQNILTIIEVGGVVAVIVTGILLFAGAGTAPAPIHATDNPNLWAGMPLAILFVLFTFGGWNDAAYISAELKERRAMVRALIWSIVAVTVLYLLVNIAYVKALGLGGIAKSGTPAADVLRALLGEGGALFISAIIAISALTSINATIIVGARSNYALGSDWRIFRWLGQWDSASDAPRNALITQALVALGLILGSVITGKGFQTLVEYTMPVFWFFVMLVGVGVFVLRAKEPDVPRPFKVPLYPITPILFILTCAYLLWSSLNYVKGGAWFGVGVIAVGALVMLIGRRLEDGDANRAS
ncbi:MAG: amino acid permease [Betaproteobacteria bacterium]|nr:amino acid permease [Betaproteobacteria bacterium]